MSWFEWYLWLKNDKHARKYAFLEAKWAIISKNEFGNRFYFQKNKQKTLKTIFSIVELSRNKEDIIANVY